MGLLRLVLGGFSYLFLGLFALFHVALAAMSFMSGAHTLQFYILPLEGRALAWGMLGLGCLGIFFVLMAMKGSLRGAYFYWSVLVLLLILRGYFLSDHRFVPDTGQVTTALWTVAAAFAAALGARLQAQRSR